MYIGSSGWFGSDCSETDCKQVNLCSGNGACIEPIKCECFQYFDGDSCDMSIGENLFSPQFDSATYKTRLNELATIGTFIIKLNSSNADKVGTRNSILAHSIQSKGDFEYFEIDKANASNLMICKIEMFPILCLIFQFF